MSVQIGDLEQIAGMKTPEAESRFRGFINAKITCLPKRRATT